MKNDADLFDVTQAYSKISFTECEKSFSIISLSFKEGSKWRLFDGNGTVKVTMLDERFKKIILDGKILFKKGDILKCKIRLTQWMTKDGLKNEIEVMSVMDHILSRFNN